MTSPVSYTHLEAKIYSATEEDIGEALEAAEKEQAKVPFYAQNELLLDVYKRQK